MTMKYIDQARVYKQGIDAISKLLAMPSSTLAGVLDALEGQLKASNTSLNNDTRRGLIHLRDIAAFAYDAVRNADRERLSENDE